MPTPVATSELTGQGGTAEDTPTTQPPPADGCAAANPMGLARVWRFEAPEDIVWDLDAASLDGGPWLDLVAGAQDGVVYAFDVNGQETWRQRSNGPVRAVVAVDLDQDQAAEVIVGGDDGRLRLMEGVGGTVSWDYALGAPVTALLGGQPAVDQFVAGTADGRLVVFDADGSLRWDVRLDSVGALALGASTSVTHLAAADLEGDPTPELVASTASGRLAALESGGRELWRLDLGSYVRQFALADLTGDGRPEVIVGTAGGQVVTVSGDDVGAVREPPLLWRWEAPGSVPAVAAADLDGDGTAEVLVGSGPAPGTVSALTAGGELLWQREVSGGVWALAAGDLDGDEIPELLAGADDGVITLIDPDGCLRGTFATGARAHGLRVVVLNPDVGPQVAARAGDFVYLLDAAVQSSGERPRPPDPSLLQAPAVEALPMADSGGVRLLAAGNVVLARSVLERSQLYGAGYPFAALADLLAAADLATVNLECVLVDPAGWAAGENLFQGPTWMADGLASAGVDVAFIANNHILDAGVEGLNATISALAARGIAHTGAGVNLEAATTPAVIEVNGTKVALLAFTESAPLDWYAGPDRPGAAPADVETIRTAVERARGVADQVVVALHSAVGYETEVRPTQAAAARAAIDAGASLVIGVGGLVVQPAERYNEGVIAYNLGNFVLDFDAVDAARNGALLRAVLTPAGDVGAVREPPLLDLARVRIVNEIQPHLEADVEGALRVESPQATPIEVAEPPPDDGWDPITPNSRPRYELVVDLDYVGHRASVSERLSVSNFSRDQWTEVVLNISPAYWGHFTLDRAQVVLGAESWSSAAALDPVETTMLHVPLPRPLEPGEVVGIEIDYRLALPPLDPQGWVPIYNAGWGPHVIQMGDWYPALVPYRSGVGWQTWRFHPVGDPVRNLLADYEVTITAPADVVVAGAGLQGREGEARRFRLDNARAFGFLASDEYVYSEGSADGIPIRLYVTEARQTNGPVVMQTIVNSIRLFSQLYGPYPHNEFVMAENGFLTAVEYSGLVALSSVAFDIYDGTEESLLVSITAHEVGHQWWYSSVGNDQVYEGWLDESMAMLCELLYYERYFPASVDWWWYYRSDRWNPTGTVDRDIYEYQDSPSFVHDMYGMSIHFLADLRDLMGRPAFEAMLADYYQTNRFGFVTKADFVAAVRRHTDADLGPLFGRYFRSGENW